MKMGWKPGQGVGPRVNMKQKKLMRREWENMGKVYGCELPSNFDKHDDESDESDIDVDLEGITFAPDDYKTYIAVPKLNLFGLGYQGMDRRTVLSSKKQELSKLTVNGKTIRGQVGIFCKSSIHKLTARPKFVSDESVQVSAFWGHCEVCIRLPVHETRSR